MYYAFRFDHGTTIEPHVRGFKIPASGYANPNVFSVKFLHFASHATDYWNPDGTQESVPDGTEYTLDEVSAMDDGVFLTPEHFSANVISIKGSVTNFRMDLIGHYYNR